MRLNVIGMWSPFEAKQILLKLLVLALATAIPHDWTLTEVSESWIGSNSVQQEQIEIQNYDGRVSRLHMAAACGAREWCRTACDGRQRGVFLLALISAAHNQDPSGPPLMKCLTHGRRNNFITAQSGVKVHDSSSLFSTHSDRVPENLLDGVYDFTMENCFLTNMTQNPFIVFDFGSERAVSSALVMAQPNEKYALHFYNLDVRIGMYGASGNFSGYTRLGYLEGPAPHPNFELNFYAAVPVLGRFLSLQIISEWGKLQVCHLEVE